MIYCQVLKKYPKKWGSALSNISQPRLFENIFITELFEYTIIISFVLGKNIITIENHDMVTKYCL